MEDFRNTLISGEILKQISKDVRYIALTTTDVSSYSHVEIYPGLNEKELNNNNYIYGGFDIVAENDFYKIINNINTYDCYWTLEIPDDATIYVNKKKFQTNKFIALEQKDLKDLPCWKDEDLCLKIIEQHGILIKYVDIDNIIMKKICEIAVNEDSNALEYIPEEYQTENMCFKELRKYHWIFEYIKNPTDEMRMYAVKEDGHHLRHIEPKDQTEEIV